MQNGLQKQRRVMTRRPVTKNQSAKLRQRNFNRFAGHSRRGFKRGRHPNLIRSIRSAALRHRAALIGVRLRSAGVPELAQVPAVRALAAIVTLLRRGLPACTRRRRRAHHQDGAPDRGQGPKGGTHQPSMGANPRQSQSRPLTAAPREGFGLWAEAKPEAHRRLKPSRSANE